MAAPRRGPLHKENENRERDADPQLSLWSTDSEAENPDSALERMSGSSAASAPPPSFPSDQEQAPRPEPEPPWSLEDLGAFILFAFFSFVFANMAVLIAIPVLRRRFPSQVTIDQALSGTPWVICMQTGWELLWLGFIYLIVSGKYHRRFWPALKWVKTPYSPAGFLVAGAAVALGLQWIYNLFPSQKQLPIEKLFTGPESAYLLAVFGIVVAPFVEEMVFRGFFYPVFERLWGFTAAVLLTALLFAGIHIPQLSGGWYEIAAIFVVGILFSYVRGKTSSLVPSYLMHLAYNTALFVTLYVTTDHFRNLKG